MHLNARPVFFSRMRRTFDHLDNRSGFWIDPPDRRGGAKRTIQPPLAHLPNFLRTLHRLSNPMPLTGRPAEHLRGSRHALLTSSAIPWFLAHSIPLRLSCACPAYDLLAPAREAHDGNIIHSRAPLTAANSRTPSTALPNTKSVRFWSGESSAMKS